MNGYKRRSGLESSRDKRRALKIHEEAGNVSDSTEVRTKLIQDMNDGLKTLKEIQKELEQIKKSGKKNNLLTRCQVYRVS